MFMKKHDKIDEKDATFKEIAQLIATKDDVGSVITLLLDQD